MSSIQMQRFLKAIDDNGGFLTWLDDEHPRHVSHDLIREARRAKFISYSDGDFWQPTCQVHLLANGRRAIGYDEPVVIEDSFLTKLLRVLKLGHQSSRL